MPVMAVVMMVVVRRRCVAGHDIFLDHDRSRLDHDGRRSGHGGADPRILHRRDHRLRHTLLVQQDNVADLQLLLYTARLDLRDHYRFAQPAARHVDDVADRDRRLRRCQLLLLVGVGALLLSVILLLSLLADFFVAGVADHRAADSTERTTDGRSRAGLVVVITDQRPGNRAAESANHGTPLRVLSLRCTA